MGTSTTCKGPHRWLLPNRFDVVLLCHDCLHETDLETLAEFQLRSMRYGYQRRLKQESGVAPSDFGQGHVAATDKATIFDRVIRDARRVARGGTTDVSVRYPDDYSDTCPCCRQGCALQQWKLTPEEADRLEAP